MKIVIVGATGIIGSAVVAALENRHEVIAVSRNKADINVDITDLSSIKALFEKIGAFDALISTTGSVHFGALKDFTPEKWMIGLQSKLMGQINLVMEGLKYINDNGSFTVTTGVLSHDPIRFGTSATMVNRALEGFVSSAALELSRGIRINAVSPTIISESIDEFGSYFLGYDHIPASKAALGYVKSVEGLQTGKTFEINGVI